MFSVLEKVKGEMTSTIGLLNFWISNRGNAIPSNENFMPEKGSTLIPSLGVYKKQNVGDYSIPHVGPRLVGLLGFDASGMSIHDALPPKIADGFVDNLDNLLEMSCGVLSIHKKITKHNSLLKIHKLMLPLTDIKGDNNFVVFAVDSRETFLTEMPVPEEDPRRKMSSKTIYLNLGTGAPHLGARVILNNNLHINTSIH